MQLNDFIYDLPESLIASYPTSARTASRLMTIDIGASAFGHRRFPDLVELLHPGDLLVFNDTRVIAARLFGHKASGGKVEILIERLLGGQQVLAQLRVSKPPAPGSTIVLGENANTGAVPTAVEVTVEAREEGFYRLKFPEGMDILSVLDRIGHVPLPPYIKRGAQLLDRERYQTVYSAVPGAVAAPTAGLHFDEELIARLKARGIGAEFITLHVGAGTFLPVRVENLETHKMHSELINVPLRTCKAIRECHSRGGRVVAVGTTTVRSLETAALSGQLLPFHGETDIFIRPGFQFRVVDVLITNFHLPGSTLLMLVSAFAGRELVMDAYAEAISRKYRFFSYGDAMLLYGQPARV